MGHQQAELACLYSTKSQVEQWFFENAGSGARLLAGYNVVLQIKYDDDVGLCTSDDT